MLDTLMHSKKNIGFEDNSSGRFREMIQVLRQRDLLHGITPVKIRQILEDLGPTFVKFGQIMSMRPDFLPQEYCDELMKLQMSVKPLPFDEIKRIVEEEYLCHWHQVFSSISEDVLGSASIAQVHRAVLKSGERVVLKVQRPGIYEIMSQDIVLLKRAAKLLQVAGGKELIDFSLVLDEMWMIAKQEMDFLMEAGHLEEFRQMNASEPNIECPKVYHKLTTARILVMEFVDGVRIDDIKALHERGFDMDQLGRRLGENYVKLDIFMRTHIRETFGFVTERLSGLTLE